MTISVRGGLRAASVYCVLAAVSGAMAQGAPPAPPVSVARPVVKKFQEWEVFTGRFEARDTVELRARVPGYLNEVHFTDGALVKKGDLLFTIDQRPYVAAVQQAEAALKVAETALKFAEGDIERAEALHKTRNISDQAMDQRRQAFQQARAQANGSRAALNAAKLNLEFTEIRAPVEGLISRRLVAPGNIVTANDTLLTVIVSRDPMMFYFDIDEATFLVFSRIMKAGGETATGLDVYVSTSDEAVQTRKATIDFIDNRLDAASGTMRLRARVDNSDRFLTSGLFGKVRLPVSPMKRGVLVPEEAVASDQTRRIVYQVAEDGAVKPLPVVTGPKVDGYRVIRSGLSGEETIAVNGLVRIRPGVKVAPQKVELPPVKAAP